MRNPLQSVADFLCGQQALVRAEIVRVSDGKALVQFLDRDREKTDEDLPNGSRREQAEWFPLDALNVLRAPEPRKVETRAILSVMRESRRMTDLGFGDEKFEEWSGPLSRGRCPSCGRTLRSVSVTVAPVYFAWCGSDGSWLWVKADRMIENTRLES